MRKYRGLSGVRKIEIDCYVLFSGIFFVLAALLLWCFHSAGKSLLYQGDAYIQGYPYIVQQITYVKEFLYNLFVKGTLEIPLIDYTTGFGMDTMVYITKYPIVLLGVLCPEAYYPVFYEFVSIALLYIAGIVFLKYCRYIKISGKIASVAGALVYLFCGFALFAVSRYASFIYYLAYFPLCLIGVERVLKERKINTLTLSSCMLFIISWYLGYMISVLVVVYCLVRLVPELFHKHMAGFFSKGFMLAGAYLLGILLAAFVWAPGIYAFLNSCRSGENSQNYSSLFYYDISYYKSLILGFFSPSQNPGYEMYTGFIPIVLLGTMILLIKKNTKARQLKAFLFVAALFSMIPLFGKIFNGGGYVSNRWCFGLAFVLGVIVTYAIPYFFELSMKELIIIIAVTTFVGAGYFLLGIKYKNLYIIISSGLIIIQMLVVSLCSMEKIEKVFRNILLLSSVAASVAVFIIFSFYPLLNDYVNAYKDEDINAIFNSNYISEVENIEDDSFYRVDTPWNETNFAVYYKYNGTAVYNSLLADTVSRLFEELSMNTERYAFQLTGLDGRAILNDIFAVKYFICPKRCEKLVPYGFELFSSEENGDIYVNTQAMPIAYTYSNAINKEKYDALSALERQEALIQGAVLEESIEGIQEAEYENNYIQVPFEISGTENVQMSDDNTIQVNEGGGKINLTVNGPKNAETYLVLEGLKLVNGSRENRCWVHMEGASKQFILLSEENQYYVDDDVTVNLGYSAEGMKSCSIAFPNAGIFSYDSIKVLAYPMEEYNIFKADMLEESFEKIVIGTNSISGTIEVKDKKMLQFSVPYSSGWTAYVDGQKRKIYNTDTMFMSIVLEPGKHNIVLKYSTPLLNEGIIVSLAATIIIVGLNVFLKLRKLRK